jgi:hypothetical protein
VIFGRRSQPVVPVKPCIPLGFPGAPTIVDWPAQCAYVERAGPRHPIKPLMMGRLLLLLIDRKCRSILFPAAVDFCYPSQDARLSIDGFVDSYLLPAAKSIEANAIPACAPDPRWIYVSDYEFDGLAVSIRQRYDGVADIHHVRFDVRRSKEIVAHDAAAVARDIAVLEEMYELEPTAG